jgi:hypothetical protein
VSHGSVGSVAGGGRTEWRGRLRVKQIIETDRVVSVVLGFQGAAVLRGL